MDNVTHTITGLMMSRCGLGKATTRGGAVLLMLAANAPDLDVFYSGFPGSGRYLEFHRGITHSLLLSPVLALVALLLAHLLVKADLHWRTFLVSWIGVLSHLLLDLTNVYGVRLGLPFSAHWFRLDINDIVDPWIWGFLFLALAAPALASLVNSEIGGRAAAKAGARAKVGWAWFAIIALLSYDGFRWVAHQRALALMEAHVYGGNVQPKFTAVPITFNPLRWRGIVETEEFVLTEPIDLAEDYDPSLGRVDYPTLRSAAIEAARATPPFQSFLEFNQLPFWRVSPAGDLIRVELLDLRFGTPWAPGFAAMALVSPDGSVKEARFSFSGSR